MTTGEIRFFNKQYHMKKLSIAIFLSIVSFYAFSQEDGNIIDKITGNSDTDEKDYGQITGNFETKIQSYTVDTLIGIYSADVPDEKVLSNSFLNLTYTKGRFSAGIRYEAYLNTMLGFDPRYDGHGIANRYASFTSDEFEITVGNFYEQFGNGLILRAYEEKTLGIDNAFDGVNVKYKPIPGIKLTGLIGTQRYYWEKAGLVKGLDGEININETFKKLSESKTRIVLGGSFVTKFQKDADPFYNYPENVGAYAGRFSLSRNALIISGEYAQKINDPSFDNGNIFKDGNAQFLNISWSKKGIGILISALRLDNMSFRSDRSASLNDLTINYLPAIAKTHAYPSTGMYPFSTQPNGQMGINAEFFYTFQKGTVLGGKYGTTFSLNFSQVNALKTNKIIVDPNAEIPNLDGYTTDIFAIGDELYYKDLNFELQKKISKRFKFSITYMYEDYNKWVIQKEDTMLHADIGVLDMTYKLSSKHALRLESHILIIDNTSSNQKQDFGNWYMSTLEYTFSPNWFFALTDQYNAGGIKHDAAHYYYVAGGFTKGSNRIQLGYGRQREGIKCVGGVCTFVPAATGFNLTLSSTF
jgi:hypothetical protein